MSEEACPFCAAALPAKDAACATTSRARPATRAALLFAGAATVAACGATEPTVVALYGPAPVEDSGASDSGTTDAAKDGPDLEEGGPVALYGPAPVDSGIDDDASDSG